jgi:hypothetical protein
MVYRRWLNGLDTVNLPVNTKITNATGPNVIQGLIQKQTGQLMRSPREDFDRREMFDPVRNAFKKMFS